MEQKPHYEYTLKLSSQFKKDFLLIYGETQCKRKYVSYVWDHTPNSLTSKESGNNIFHLPSAIFRSILPVRANYNRKNGNTEGIYII